MMIRRISLLLFVMLVTAGLVFAAGATKTTTTTVKGTVEKVDTSAHTMSVTVGKDMKNFTFNDKTYFFEGKAKIKADQVKQGDQITITADSKNYVRTAKIEASTSAAAPAPATKTKAH